MSEESEISKAADMQMMLFEPWTAIGESKLTSRTLQIYDLLPRFAFRKKRYLEKVEMIKTTIQVKTPDGDALLEVDLAPAILRDKEQKVILVFPGEREELVERAIRHIASKSVMVNDVEEQNEYAYMRVTCTLSQIRKELISTKHSLDLSQIKEALEVMDGCKLRISGHTLTDHKGRNGGIISNLSFNYKNDDESGTLSYVTFLLHPLAAKAVHELAFFPLNQERIMGLRSPLARWLATKMNHSYRQAHKHDATNSRGWAVTLETILNESGITREERMRDNLPTVRAALGELLEAGYLSPLRDLESIEEVIYGTSAGGRKPIIGACWILYPSSIFANEITVGNVEMQRKRNKTKERPRLNYISPDRKKGVEGAKPPLS